MALCCLLAFSTGGDAQRVDRLFRESGLMREKWDAVHSADGATYGERTIERACRVTSERYNPPAGSEPPIEETTDFELVSRGTSKAKIPADERSTLALSRSKAHLEEKTRILQQHLDEQSARVEALEAALRRRSPTSAASTPAQETSSPVE
jgi:primase-polymerase (primpol)-like protein